MGLAFQHGLEDLPTERKPSHQEQDLPILRCFSMGISEWRLNGEREKPVEKYERNGTESQAKSAA
jgi:hypothetical protein